jgi:S1-C subfamily serine protease
MGLLRRLRRANTARAVVWSYLAPPAWGSQSLYGLHAGDVILQVGGKAVSTPSDVRKDFDEARASGKNSVLMRVLSGKETKFVALP